MNRRREELSNKGFEETQKQNLYSLNFKFLERSEFFDTEIKNVNPLSTVSLVNPTWGLCNYCS